MGERFNLLAFLFLTFHFVPMSIADTTNDQLSLSPSEVFKDGTMVLDVEQGLSQMREHPSKWWTIRYINIIITIFMLTDFSNFLPSGIIAGNHSQSSSAFVC